MPKINCEQIPAVELRNLARVFCAGMKKAFQDPKIIEEFEEWKRQQAEEKTRQQKGA